MIANIRTHSQQLTQPSFSSPPDLVSWMGAVQAQSYDMAKWAIAIRTQSATLQSVNQALESGTIIRTHIMRPTWHLVPANDIRWMLQLSNRNLKSANQFMSKKYGITEKDISKCNKFFEKTLKGNKSLTRLELIAEMNKHGYEKYSPRIYLLMFNAETKGLICSGVDKAGKPTYALLDERVAPSPNLHKDEALATLASRYFQSHSPATFDDFVWWSGLSITEARHAIHLIQSDLITDRFEETHHLIHQSCAEEIKTEEEIIHLLPSYDEYLISYKVRTDVLPLEHHSKAFNNYGIFQPVIMYNGKVVANWKKTVKKGNIEIETSFFEPKFKIDTHLLNQAKEKYTTYLK